jgi:pyrrolidone-carboxylate peptidase
VTGRELDRLADVGESRRAGFVHIPTRRADALHYCANRVCLKNNYTKGY